MCVSPLTAQLWRAAGYRRPSAVSDTIPYHLRLILITSLTKSWYFCGGFCIIAIPNFLGHLSLHCKSLSVWTPLFTAHSKWLEEKKQITAEDKDNFKHEVLISLWYFFQALLGSLRYTNYCMLQIAVGFLKALEPEGWSKVCTQRNATLWENKTQSHKSITHLYYLYLHFLPFTSSSLSLLSTRWDYLLLDFSKVVIQLHSL